jgi:hypothetical protein
MRRGREVRGALLLAGRAAIVAIVAMPALVAVVCAGSTVRLAGAGEQPSGESRSLPTSPFVARARQGEVAVPTAEEVERMCALLTSCDKVAIPPALFPADFQGCVKRMSDEMTSPGAVNFSLTMRECGLRADSCASFRACALHGASPDACKGRGKQAVVGFCDVDGRALTCWHDDVLAVRDCNRGGEQCVVVDGEAACTLGPCPPGVKEGDKSSCSVSGTHSIRCEKGKLASLDCTAFGLKCTTALDGSSGCATGGPPCRGKEERRCDGNVAVGCIHGHEVRVDCAAAGLVCAQASGQVSGVAPVGACAAPPALSGPCDVADKARCDETGTAIQYCYAGRSRSYSCKALGFRKCDPGKNGARCSSQ